jgi:hypothetical protein
MSRESKVNVCVVASRTRRLAHHVMKAAARGYRIVDESLVSRMQQLGNVSLK